MRIWIISDIHVDFTENLQWVKALSSEEYTQDVLILAGDVTHRFDLFRNVLEELRSKFKMLFFVPGNHDLWVRDEPFVDSLQKFEAILRFCKELQIQTQPTFLTTKGQSVLIFPLFSWYHLQNEHGTLYLPKPGEAPLEKLWSDYHFIKWPNHQFRPVEYFVKLNEQPPSNEKVFTITFSHFLPRQENMFSENRTLDRERLKKYDRNPQFNFSQVAGSTLIEKKLREIGAQLHVYGHQHINRDRVIEGVRYVAHCLGYPEERRRGTVKGIEQGLKCIWP